MATATNVVASGPMATLKKNSPKAAELLMVADAEIEFPSPQELENPLNRTVAT